MNKDTAKDTIINQQKELGLRQPTAQDVIDQSYHPYDNKAYAKVYSHQISKSGIPWEHRDPSFRKNVYNDFNNECISPTRRLYSRQTYPCLPNTSTSLSGEAKVDKNAEKRKKTQTKLKKNSLFDHSSEKIFKHKVMVKGSSDQSLDIIPVADKDKSSLTKDKATIVLGPNVELDNILQVIKPKKDIPIIPPNNEFIIRDQNDFNKVPNLSFDKTSPLNQPDQSKFKAINQSQNSLNGYGGDKKIIQEEDEYIEDSEDDNDKNIMTFSEANPNRNGVIISPIRPNVAKKNTEGMRGHLKSDCYKQDESEIKNLLQEME